MTRQELIRILGYNPVRSDHNHPIANVAKNDPDIANSITHSNSAHAPSNAQKNSDITIQEIESKLIGVITSHQHQLNLGYSYFI